MPTDVSSDEVSATVIVTRLNDDGTYEVVSLEFLKGLAGFTQWVNSLPKAVVLVDSGGRHKKVGEDLWTYEPTSDANVVAIFMQAGRSSYQYSWKTDDMGWTYMKSTIADQDRSTIGRGGRPRKLVQPLQTWRKWAKKDGAPL